MSINTSPNTDYTLMAPELQKVRDAVLGSFFVKRKPLYLPHPSQVDTSSPEQIERYRQYTAGAEFPEYTDSTLISMLDKMRINDVNIELNDKINYLAENSDGDGLSLKGLMESCASNVLQVKWHVLLADYKGLTDLATDDPSIEDVEKGNLRATINQYTRENVLDWAFGRVNGRMQLVYILLRECGEIIDTESGTKSEVESFLKLAIDSEGYYQQKLTSSTDGVQEGEVNRVEVNGQPLDFIPLEFVSDSEMQAGELPLDTGFLTGVANLAYARYAVSADYKESLRSLVPIVTASGIDDMDDFKEDNGRDYFATGALAVNIVRNENAKITITESGQTLDQYQKYFDQNEKDVKAIGGVYNSDAAVQKTATESLNQAAAQVAVLTPMVNSIESSLTTMCLYCGMFEGVYPTKDLSSHSDDVIIVMPRDFAATKLTFNEVKTYIELFNNGQMSQQEMLRVLDLGGWTISDAETLGLEIANSGGNLTD